MRTLERTKVRVGLGLIALPVLVVACAGIAYGQSRTSAPPVPEVMQSLEKALAGKWSTTYEFASEGPSHTERSGAGEEDWRTGPGGYVLMEEEHFRGPSGEVYILALHWWDKSTNSLRGMLCNNSGPEACNVDTYLNSTLK